MAGGEHHVERDALDLELVAFGHAHRDDVGLGLLAHHRDALCPVAQGAEAGDVIGVKVGVDRLDQLQVEFGDQLEIAVDFLQHRIDDQGFAAAPACEQVRIGPRGAVKQLAKNHPAILLVAGCSRQVRPRAPFRP